MEQNIMSKGISAENKFMLTIPEAMHYFNLGETKLRLLCDTVGRQESFVLHNGNRILVKRKALEKYLSAVDQI